MILYSEDTSPYCAPVRALIYAKDLDLMVAPPPGGLRSEDYRALTGTGTIPCLILDDGTPLPESTAILEYLDERFPEPSLLPGSAEARGKARLLVRLGLDGAIGPMVGLFHDLAEGLPSAQATARERLEAGLDRIERFLSAEGFAAGPEFSQADCVLGPSLMGVVAFGPMLGVDLLAANPKLAAYWPRAAAHPAVARVIGELQAALAASPLPG